MRPVRQPGRGFTLIEMLIVVAVIGIIASIAFPSYVESVRRGQRASAKARMFDLQSRLQRYYSENGKYTSTLTDLQFPASLKSETKGHDITLALGTPGDTGTFKITATPVKADPKCPTLTLDHLGVYGPPNC